MKLLLTFIGIGGVGSTAAVTYSIVSNKNAQIEALFQEILEKIKKFSAENPTIKNLKQGDKNEDSFSNLLSFLGSLLNESDKQNNESFSKNQEETKKAFENESSKTELEEIYKKIEDFSNLINNSESMKKFYKGKIIDLLKKTKDENKN